MSKNGDTKVTVAILKTQLEDLSADVREVKRWVVGAFAFTLITLVGAVFGFIWTTTLNQTQKKDPVQVNVTLEQPREKK